MVRCARGRGRVRIDVGVCKLHGVPLGAGVGGTCNNSMGRPPPHAFTTVTHSPVRPWLNFTMFRDNQSPAIVLKSFLVAAFKGLCQTTADRTNRGVLTLRTACHRPELVQG